MCIVCLSSGGISVSHNIILFSTLTKKYVLLLIGFSPLLTCGFSNKSSVPKLWHHLPTLSFTVVDTTLFSTFDSIIFAGCMRGSRPLRGINVITWGEMAAVSTSVLSVVL